MICKKFEWQIFVKCIGLTLPKINNQYTVITLSKKENFIEIIYRWLSRNKIYHYRPLLYPLYNPLPGPTDKYWIGKPNWFRLIQLRHNSYYSSKIPYILLRVPIDTIITNNSTLYLTILNSPRYCIISEEDIRHFTNYYKEISLLSMSLSFIPKEIWRLIFSYLDY